MIYSRIAENPTFNNKEDIISNNEQIDFELLNIENKKVVKNKKIIFILNS